jgi:hypothetical protein
VRYSHSYKNVLAILRKAEKLIVQRQGINVDRLPEPHRVWAKEVSQHFIKRKSVLETAAQAFTITI